MLGQIVMHRVVDNFRNAVLTCGFTQSLDTYVIVQPRTRGRLRIAKALCLAILGSVLLFPSGANAVTNNGSKQPTFKDYLKIYAHSKIVVESQYKCFNVLMERESKWSHTARNGSHYGIGQMRSLWYKRLNAYQQIDASIAYISKRYGHSCHALAFHNKRGYY